MDSVIRKAQKNILRVFAQQRTGFALAGGTALELYYLHHRFSSDLDFFSPDYDHQEIRRLISAFKKKAFDSIQLENELMAPGKAQVQFYSVPIKGANRPLKLDFIEDVFLKKPVIQKHQGVRVYSVKDIYNHKIAAISGSHTQFDEIGRSFIEGRKASRDVFDLYMLSKKIQPLHQIMQNIQPLWQKGMVHWYRTFSRQDLKLDLVDMDIYEQHFDAGEMIRYLESEMKQFIKKVIHQ